jgi:hypothetical protein
MVPVLTEPAHWATQVPGIGGIVLTDSDVNGQ